MEWHRNRQAVTKHELAMAQIDLSAYINTRMAREALSAGADPIKDKFVYVRRSDEWYVTFGLDINPPDDALEIMRKRGWEIDT